MKASHEVLSTEYSVGCDNGDRCTELAAGAAETSTLAYQHRVAFGRNLHQARVGANLTLEHVAAMTGLSENCLGAIEAGQCDPRLKAMTALAHVVDRELWTLLSLPDSGGQ